MRRTFAVLPLLCTALACGSGSSRETTEADDTSSPPKAACGPEGEIPDGTATVIRYRYQLPEQTKYDGYQKQLCVAQTQAIVCVDGVISDWQMHGKGQGEFLFTEERCLETTIYTDGGLKKKSFVRYGGGGLDQDFSLGPNYIGYTEDPDDSNALVLAMKTYWSLPLWPPAQTMYGIEPSSIDYYTYSPYKGLPWIESYYVPGPNENGVITSQPRPDGPALIQYERDSTPPRKIHKWTEPGRGAYGGLHKLDGPALISYYLDTNALYEESYWEFDKRVMRKGIYGKRYCTDGVTPMATMTVVDSWDMIAPSPCP